VFAWWLNQVDAPFLPLHVLANPVMRKEQLRHSADSA